ncbi:PREDICTED: potassium voltage-gated channel subfamily E member 3 isoform X4 [Chinchilla lanigera]|uniref:potassium voltage-gated channel subfamily E member 3 isoform X4 n=1 Tax=Chinchilla lanigera TaxID=34839 RepID=UPI00038EBFBC|nr:PREDICTED: potassium voltage-gated channel subfamily E member 3 isoform X4 [Chinchilla lanigera]
MRGAEPGEGTPWGREKGADADERAEQHRGLWRSQGRAKGGEVRPGNLPAEGAASREQTGSLGDLPRSRESCSSSLALISVAMETTNRTETWYESLHAVLKALNATLHNNLLCRPGPQLGPGPDNQTEERRASLPGRDDNSYMYILFVMFLFAVTVGSLILGYTRSRKVDKRSDPYHVYIKNRVSMI